MTYQNGNCCQRTENRYWKAAICFLALVLLFTIGLILGAVFAQQILAALPAVIVFAAAVLVVLIALLLTWRKRN